MTSSKKLIWIDGYEANVEQRLGSGQVAFELLKHLEQIDHLNDYLILLPSSPLSDLPKEREGWKYKILKFNKLWTRVALPLEIFRAKIKPDLFFSPTHYIPTLTNVKRVVMVFDTGFLHFPETLTAKDLWKLKNWTKYSIRNAQHIVTISESAKRDILKNYQVSSEKVTVAYPGHSDKYIEIKDEAKIKEISSKYKLDKNYVLFIGTIQPRKNLSRLIEAFKTIEGVQLAISGKTTGPGKQGWKFKEILDKPRRLGIETKIKFLGFVPDEDLVYLLNGAKAFVFPSLWEGFGIPVVDAMSVGKPVIVSTAGSLPEIVGEAGILVDPLNIEEIRNAIVRVCEDAGLRDELSIKALEQAKIFSWKKMAEQVLEVFKEASNE
ncbi:hypothetical protein A2631_02735 [Candidatus Daviesbacteria bacterium RIFCSPHIGHO2_01_FULL_44_29]|uniref:Glycosyl transferase family 1 domain-containing protein n=1 Tax=Candidatus Daviesbacteria bacterium RIFCSPHIGHO2_02_FULL_43_12 TaxID=1797776 RepID=A0A1F5KKG1_9BACT|nr:MAG: hypothetical protein A2631_02735 [Candidatus Daviesbacteria bacterium RIFCSPHIGHO2_01_FULL_44_29]OGE40845.1 MAG: hypothetical protein A3E86_02615 [Candidatus Daviesbacteria bacterium RIFCSPHIGHO2_12_FULL_47_45]OGE41300.1 MAG: hypothetical protein A3D25_02130 [Candidatus Daviesbacteria bacterium RIFCSPHIGHO2_02_FULL_43_12]OGE69501.1 MAG: hypothetical protein A3B55_03870 [Candidatus Daviesbacteria bacterium RIFCSPLOWO2_01_FULL_43_15]